MANKEITELTAAAAIDGTELLHIVQAGNSRQASIDDVMAWLFNIYEPADGEMLIWDASAGAFANGIGGGGLADAPSDGDLYARRDGAWEAFTAGGGGGAGAFTVIYEFDHSVDGNTAQPALTDLDYQEIVVFMLDVEYNTGEFHGFIVSTDNGSSYFRSGSPYRTQTSATAAPGLDSVRMLTSSNTGPRSTQQSILNAKDSGVGKFGQASGQGIRWYAPSITGAVDAIFLGTDHTSPKTMVGGSILVLGR